MLSSRSLSGVLAVVGAAAVLSPAVQALAPSSTSDGVVVCAATAAGTLRAVRPDEACLPVESRFSLGSGERGPQGPAGPQGATGAQGPKGDRGEKGDPGSALRVEDADGQLAGEFLESNSLQGGTTYRVLRDGLTWYLDSRSGAFTPRSFTLYWSGDNCTGAPYVHTSEADNSSLLATDPLTGYNTSGGQKVYRRASSTRQDVVARSYSHPNSYCYGLYSAVPVYALTEAGTVPAPAKTPLAITRG